MSEGGIITAVAEMCFGGDMGALLDAAALKSKRLDHALFNETAGCFVIEVSRENYECGAFDEIDHRVIGQTTGSSNVTVTNDEKILFDVTLGHLLQVWRQPIKELFNQ